MGKSRMLVNAETTLIRKFIERRLPLGKSHEDIIKELGISRATYFRYVKRIMNKDAEVWDKVHMDSTKYRATRLIDALLNCLNLANEIMSNPNEDSRVRLEAARTAAEAEVNIYKVIAEGPTFRVSLPVYQNQNNNKELTNDNDSLHSD